jgi:hypothetical protein
MTRKSTAGDMRSESKAFIPPLLWEALYDYRVIVFFLLPYLFKKNCYLILILLVMIQFPDRESCLSYHILQGTQSSV